MSVHSDHLIVANIMENANALCFLYEHLDGSQTRLAYLCITEAHPSLWHCGHLTYLRKIKWGPR